MLTLLLLLFHSSAALVLVPRVSRESLSLTASTSSSINLADAGGSFESPKVLVGKGMDAFRRGDVQGSIEYFDAAENVGGPSLRPYLWQRGLSYYYADDFQKGSQQFKFDVSVNPLDVEEIVWDIACLTRMQNPSEDAAFPPPTAMSLPKGKKDRRKIMSTVYSLFRGEATEKDLAMAGYGSNIADEFYSLFYLGLYCEIRGDIAKASNYMKSAATSKYSLGPGSYDYMTACAKVHCNLRGW